VKKKYIIRRSGARPGDLIYSTGCFGDSGAGLYLLSHGAGKRGKTERCLVNKHLLPEPRIAESKIIAANGLATSMIDSSDGLSASVGFLATESGIGAKIFLDSVPLSTEMQEFKKKYVKADFWNIVTGGGEEYELVFTAAPGKRRSIERLLPRAVCFGEIAKGRDVMYYFNGNRIDVNAKGFEHFR
jgi:thiamine-monophosphate kinase